MQPALENCFWLYINIIVQLDANKQQQKYKKNMSMNVFFTFVHSKPSTWMVLTTVTNDQRQSWISNQKPDLTSQIDKMIGLFQWMIA